MVQITQIVEIMPDLHKLQTWGLKSLSIVSLNKSKGDMYVFRHKKRKWGPKEDQQKDTLRKDES